MRSALTRNVQGLQALERGPGPGRLARGGRGAGARAPRVGAHRMARQRLAIRQRRGLAFSQAGVRAPGPRQSNAEVQQACMTARRVSGRAYSGSHFEPQATASGLEVMELCLPEVRSASSGLRGRHLFAQRDAGQPGRTRNRPQPGMAFTEADGTRLAMHGWRGAAPGLHFPAAAGPAGQHHGAAHGQLAPLPPDLFPNVLTALVTVMSVALVAVLCHAGQRHPAAAAGRAGPGRCAGLPQGDGGFAGDRLARPRPAGRITYVNPAFCQMVGFTPEELLGHGTPAPYWPPERAEEYGKRQAVRLREAAPPREGFESVFMRKDGSRFPVLIIEAPLINAQGMQTGWMSAVLDISEQRRVEELSRASQERLQATARLATVGEMASLLSHELNQPLAAIASYASGSMNLLQGSTPGAAAQRPAKLAMRRIGEQAERAGKRDQERARFRAAPRQGARGGDRRGADGRDAAAGEPAGPQAGGGRGRERAPGAAAGGVRPHDGGTGGVQPRAQRDAGDGRGPALRDPEVAGAGAQGPRRPPRRASAGWNSP